MSELAFREPEAKVIAGVKDDWELVIGMEVHAQVASEAKLFSGASDAIWTPRRPAAKNARLVSARWALGCS